MDQEEEFQKEITEILPSPDFPWEQFVFMGSNHLVLPALYHKFRICKMLGLFPLELRQHLAGIFEMNDTRNQQIVQEILYLNTLFRNKNIDPVFMKGAASLLSGVYSHSAERMLSDIDCLIPPKSMNDAVHLLVDEGYNHEDYRSEDLPFMHHFPSLSKEEAARIDLHYLPVTPKYIRYMENWEQRVRTIELEDGAIAKVPGSEDMIRINFLHSQLQDHGDYFAAVSMKNLYEFQRLRTGTQNSHVQASDFGRYRGKYKNYVALAASAFPSQQGISNTPGTKRRIFTLRFKLNRTFRLYSMTSRFFRTALLQMGHYAGFLGKAIYSKKHRNYLSARLRDPKWSAGHFRHLSRKF